jgi:hypothetical protein
MIRLELAGPHTHIHATLCSACPMGPAGCCATPPGIEWSDAGRIVARDGGAFLLAELAAGRLRPGARGLLIQRVDAPDAAPGPKRCTYHGPSGCTIAPDRRAATCNYYVCDDALADAGADHSEAARARRALDTLVALYQGWDRELSERVAARWPAGAPWDAAFVAWLGAEYTRLARGAPAGLSPR